MMSPDESPSEVFDFKEVLNQPFDGQLPLLVGGHAVNVWAIVYQDHLGSDLNPWCPLTSKDLDLYGDMALLESLKQRFGGDYRLSGARSPVVGQLAVTLNGKERRIDVLRNVVGLHSSELSSEHPVIQLNIDGTEYSVRVVSSLELLKAKIANLASLDQTNRNDRKHVGIMLLVNREVITGLVEKVESGKLDSRAAINFLEKVRRLISTTDAINCAKIHGVKWEEIWPEKVLKETEDLKIRNFVSHWLTS